MSILENFNDSSESTLEIGKKFTEKSYQYYKLKVFQFLTKFVSSIIKLVIVGGLVIFGIVFLSISLAILIGNHIDSNSLGFLYVGLLYIFLGLIVFAIGKYIDSNIIKKMSKKFFQPTNTKEHDL